MFLFVLCFFNVCHNLSVYVLLLFNLDVCYVLCLCYIQELSVRRARRSGRAAGPRRGTSPIPRHSIRFDVLCLYIHINKYIYIYQLLLYTDICICVCVCMHIYIYKVSGLLSLCVCVDSFH